MHVAYLMWRTLNLFKRNLNVPWKNIAEHSIQISRYDLANCYYVYRLCEWFRQLYVNDIMKETFVNLHILHFKNIYI